MLRFGANILCHLNLNQMKCGSNVYALEFVRWRRKPRWLPVAKSKMFRVPERKRQSADERAELLRLHNNYKTQMRSVRQYLREEVIRIQETSTADHMVLTPEQEEAEFQRCLQINAEWNAKIAAERQVRLEKERAATLAYVQERLEVAKLRKEEELERIEAIVRREKELSKTFITPEKLDATIETALANPIDYNFAIDLAGNLFHGRDNVTGGNNNTSATQQKDETEQMGEIRN